MFMLFSYPVKTVSELLLLAELQLSAAGTHVLLKQYSAFKRLWTSERTQTTDVDMLTLLEIHHVWARG